jgi:iron-sulfur cluster repair protein YtfE (RIC family)
MQKREDLAREYRELHGLMHALSACVAHAKPDFEEVDRLRWALTRDLAMHLIKEDRLVYPRMEGSTDRTPSMLARDFAQQMSTLVDAFRDYVVSWPQTRIQSEWKLFRKTTTLLMADLRTHIDQQQSALYPAVTLKDQSGVA